MIAGVGNRWFPSKASLLLQWSSPLFDLGYNIYMIICFIHLFMLLSVSIFT